MTIKHVTKEHLMGHAELGLTVWTWMVSEGSWRLYYCPNCGVERRMHPLWSVAVRDAKAQVCENCGYSYEQRVAYNIRASGDRP